MHIAYDTTYETKLSEVEQFVTVYVKKILHYRYIAINNDLHNIHSTNISVCTVMYSNV